MEIDLRSGVQGRVALVTGGMGGIGRALISTLLEHGANVAFTYTGGGDSDAASQALIATEPTRLSAHRLNLMEPSSIRACMESVVQRWGDLDILVNNAAVGSATVSRYAEGDEQADTAMLLINADGTLKMCQHFLQLPRREDSGASRKLVIISSVGGGVGVFPGFRLSDGMSKAAVTLLARQLAAETVHEAVDVFAVCPGATDTPMFQASTLDPMSADERTAFLEGLPKGRLIAPEEIAQVVAFLASSYSTVLHGAVIDASMGLGVRPGMMTESSH